MLIVVRLLLGRAGVRAARRCGCSGVPADGRAGHERVTVKVDEFASTVDTSIADDDGPPAAGVTVTLRRRDGDHRGRRHGAADVLRRRPADRSRRRRPAACAPAGESTCVTDGRRRQLRHAAPARRRRCRRRGPPPTRPRRSPPFARPPHRPGVLAPQARRASSRGTVSPDPSGLKSVRLSIIAQGGRALLDVRRRVGALRAPPLRRLEVVPDRRPRRLVLPAAARGCRRGRYTIKAVAIDKAGNERARPRR